VTATAYRFDTTVAPSNSLAGPVCRQQKTTPDSEGSFVGPAVYLKNLNLLDGVLL
jgi:hypothetical protein